MNKNRALYSAVAIPALLAASAATARSTKEVNLPAKRGISYSQLWQNDSGVIAPGDDGKVNILFGASQPQVVCAPLQVCDIELQAGEQVSNVNVGDIVRWKISAAKSGEGLDQKVHLIVKPVEPNLNTSLIITTSRRVYHIALRSDAAAYMARVGFIYPDEAQISPAELARVNPVSDSARGSYGGRADGLDFRYRITGKSRWKPERVYNDGLKTYIDMPSALDSSEAPALLILDENKKEKLVNYRVVDHRYIVDQLFDRAALVSGVGRKGSRIDIARYQ
ncbi:P-type conjugative transfer protein TrbG [Sphingobium sp. DEHP117]|uniref:P-type conjugative transfer protein TrbG n=1 Tax=Sphingobium sp. DEHP117 TaxID=2993436 RepID=UPI0027D513D1|nr:P-type conjugative transfer protein TrbG [Sphingobium sp. DEHP117]MDQ4422171.1 P-type conjugative transfer protein TrbG [Sphingobium sp. DEHP117]